MTFPHLNPTGLNQYRGRPTQDLSFRPVFITYGVAKLAQLMEDRAGNLRRTDSAIIEAHHVIAEDLQEAIAQALERAVEGRPGGQRDQKTDNIKDGVLPRAIRSRKNRSVVLSGFSVGHLDQTAADPYYRGLEYGSSKFVGRFLRGTFRNLQGKAVRPIEGGKDWKFSQFRRFIPVGHRLLHGGKNVPATQKIPNIKLFPGVLIRNPIKPYHYFQSGLQRSRSNGYFANLDTVAVYVSVFYEHGFDVAGDVFALALQGGAIRSLGLTNPPTPSD